MTDRQNPADILDFWWRAGPTKWFNRDDDFDQAISNRFRASYEAAAQGALDAWQADAAGMLALILLLDQCPRNMFRHDARAFATDAKARQLTLHAIAKGFDRTFPIPQRIFFYLPLMHSEAIDDQNRCVDLTRDMGDMNNYHHALIHMDAIRRFGRFPHRNAALGRPSTDAEIAYLESGGFSA